MSSCMIDVDTDGDRAQFFRQETRKARKTHRCTECWRSIEPGDTYEYVVGVWIKGDGPDVYKTCAACRSIRDAMLCGFYYGMVWEELGEWFSDTHGEDLCTEPLDEMTPEARAVFIEWFDTSVAEHEQEDSDAYCPKGKNP